MAQSHALKLECQLCFEAGEEPGQQRTATERSSSSENDLEAFELRVAQQGSFRGTCLGMRLTKSFRFRPTLKGLPRCPDRMGSVKSGLLMARSSQQVKLSKAGDGIQVRLALAPQILEDRLTTRGNPKAVHCDKHFEEDTFLHRGSLLRTRVDVGTDSMNGDRPGSRLRLRLLGRRHPHEKPARAHFCVTVIEFEPVLSLLLEREALKLDIALNGAVVADLHLHIRKAVGLAAGALQEEPQGASLILIGSLAVLQEKAEEDPHPAVSGG